MEIIFALFKALNIQSLQNTIYSHSKVVSLKLFVKSCTEFTKLDIKYHFSYDGLNFHGNTLNYKDIMSMIVDFLGGFIKLLNKSQKTRKMPICFGWCLLKEGKLEN